MIYIYDKTADNDGRCRASVNSRFGVRRCKHKAKGLLTVAGASVELCGVHNPVKAEARAQQERAARDQRIEERMRRTDRHREISDARSAVLAFVRGTPGLPPPLDDLRRKLLEAEG